MKDIVHGHFLVKTIIEVTFEKMEKSIFENLTFQRGKEGFKLVRNGFKMVSAKNTPYSNKINSYL